MALHGRRSIFRENGVLMLWQQIAARQHRAIRREIAGYEPLCYGRLGLPIGDCEMASVRQHSTPRGPVGFQEAVAKGSYHAQTCERPGCHSMLEQQAQQRWHAPDNGNVLA